MNPSFGVTALGALFLACLPFAADAGEDWEFAIAPYVLAPSIDGDAGAGRFIDGAQVEVDTRDIIESLDLGAMVHAEARHVTGFGAVVDYSFMNLSSKADGPVVPGAEIRAEVFQGVLEAFGSYRIEPAPGHSLDTYGGVRWWQIDLGLERRNASGFNASADRREGWVDPVVGLRWTASWAPGLRTSLAADIGGFGVASDATHSLQALLIYDASERVSFAAGYRALWVDYERGTHGTRDYFAYDTVTQGPQVGIVIRF